MTLGLAPQPGLLADPVDEFCDGQLHDGSLYALLHRERDRVIPDELFADLFTRRGRRSIPPSIVATVMVMARLEGLSDVEAMDRFTYDARWRYACGVGSWEDSLVEFDRTVLVRFRMKLEDSDDPRRVFRRTTEIADEAGLVGVKRVLDSAPLFDAVATMDTVTLIRSAIRGLLKVADPELEGQLRAALSGGDDYVAAGKPSCDWDDAEARAAVVDALACDGLALLHVVDGRQLEARVAERAELVALVIGQDLERDEDGVWRIVRGVATDRIISTVDPDARHGRKSTSGKFDGYKGHIAVDPDSEVITDTAAGPANTGDGQMTGRLTRDLDPAATTAADHSDDDTEAHDRDVVVADTNETTADAHGEEHDGEDDGEDGPAVYGDAAYGSGGQLAELDERGINAMVKTQPPASRGGMFSKDDFDIDLDRGTVTCPNGTTVPIRRDTHGAGKASFAGHCHGCPLREQCTTSQRGRTVSVHQHEDLLARQRQRCQDPAWVDDYRATRPKVERKLAHLVRRGRRARRRGLAKVDADWNMLAAAANLARLATLGVRHHNGTWQTAPA